LTPCNESGPAVWRTHSCVPCRDSSRHLPVVNLLTAERISAKVLAVNPLLHLSRRERQIMDALFRLGSASATEVRAAMPDPPGYSAVRATLRILEDKGAVRHQEQAGKYVYTAAVSREAARKSALRSLLTTFF